MKNIFTFLFVLLGVSCLAASPDVGLRPSTSWIGTNIMTATSAAQARAALGLDTANSVTFSGVTVGDTNVISAISGKQPQNVVADLTALVAYSGAEDMVVVSDTQYGGSFTYQASGYTADNVLVFDATGIGSGYWVRDTHGIVKAGWFGMGTGVVDNSTAINSLATWLNARGGGATVEFEPGTYTFTFSSTNRYESVADFKQCNDLSLRGNSTTFYIADVAGVDQTTMSLLTFEKCDNLRISGITFDGDAALDVDAGYGAIAIDGCSSVDITGYFTDINYGVRTGEWNGWDVDELSRNLNLVLKGYNCYYPLILMGAESVMAQVESDHAHRNTYLAGVRNVRIFGASKNCNSQDRFNLITHVQTAAGEWLGNHNVYVAAVDTGTTNGLPGSLTGFNGISDPDFAGVTVTNSNLHFNAQITHVDGENDLIRCGMMGFGTTNYPPSTDSEWCGIVLSGYFDCRQRVKDATEHPPHAWILQDSASSAEACKLTTIEMRDFTYMGPQIGDTTCWYGLSLKNATNATSPQITIINSRPGRVKLPTGAHLNVINSYLDNPGNSSISRRVGLMTTLGSTSAKDHMLVVGDSTDTVVSSGALSTDISFLNYSTTKSLWYGPQVMTAVAAPTLTTDQAALYVADARGDGTATIFAKTEDGKYGPIATGTRSSVTAQRTSLAGATKIVDESGGAIGNFDTGWTVGASWTTNSSAVVNATGATNSLSHTTVTPLVGPPRFVTMTLVSGGAWTIDADASLTVTVGGNLMRTFTNGDAPSGTMTISGMVDGSTDDVVFTVYAPDAKTVSGSFDNFKIEVLAAGDFLHRHTYPAAALVKASSATAPAPYFEFSAAGTHAANGNAKDKVIALVNTTVTSAPAILATIPSTDNNGSWRLKGKVYAAYGGGASDYDNFMLELDYVDGSGTYTKSLHSTDLTGDVFAWNAAGYFLIGANADTADGDVTINTSSVEYKP